VEKEVVTFLVWLTAFASPIGVAVTAILLWWLLKKPRGGPGWYS
jgi:hypothetical protein